MSLDRLRANKPQFQFVLPLLDEWLHDVDDDLLFR